MEPSSHGWLLLDFSPSSRETYSECVLVNSLFLLQLLHFLKMNAQKGENRANGHAGFCGLCYIMQCCSLKRQCLFLALRPSLLTPGNILPAPPESSHEDKCGQLEKPAGQPGMGRLGAGGTPSCRPPPRSDAQAAGGTHVSSG